ncbi:MAG: glycosyltransferase [Spirochaetota bacterium]
MNTSRSGRPPRVTFIIPHRETESIDNVLRCVRALDHPQKSIEVLAVSGDQPSVQRNACIRKAKGEIVYFLDNDSEVHAGNITHAVSLFQKDERIAVVGGPAEPKESDTAIQKVFSFCLCSPFGAGPVRSRYHAEGDVRETTDRELILCNLLVRKKVLDTVGVFNEAFYPNEENELMDRIRDAGYALYYHPRVAVRRSPRTDMRSFVKMLLNYGRGRFQQFIHAPRILNVMFFIPLGFVLYLASLAALPFATVLSPYALIYLAPLGLYALFLTAAAFSALPSIRKLSFSILAVPFVFFAIHAGYGVGIIWGFIRLFRKRKMSAHFKIRTVKAFSR